MKRARLAADIGGTFTDVVLEHRGRRYSTKVLTTPRELVRQILWNRLIAEMPGGGGYGKS